MKLYVLKVLEAREWLSQNASSALPRKHEFVPCGGGSESSPGKGTGTVGLWGAMAGAEGEDLLCHLCTHGERRETESEGLGSARGSSAWLRIHPAL